MKDFRDLLRDTPQLANALSSIQLNEKEKDSLRRLYASPVGFEASRDSSNRLKAETVYHCSKTGGYLSKYFEGIGPMDNMMWVGHIEVDSQGLEHWLMRSEMREAIKTLGWF